MGNSVTVTYFDETYDSYSGQIEIPSFIMYNGTKLLVRAIGPRAFYKSKGLTHVSIPTTVTSIGDYAFADCVQLQDINLPNTIKNIGIGAFSHCESLSEIVLPQSLSKLQRETFKNCSKLKRIVFGNMIKTIETGTFIQNVSLTVLEFPKSLTTIATDAFWRCSSLNTIIACSKTEFCKNAFRECDSIKDVFSYRDSFDSFSLKSIDERAFGNSVFENATLHVPEGCGQAYLDSKGWKNFLNISGKGDFCVDGIVYLRKNASSRNVRLIGVSNNVIFQKKCIEIPETIKYLGKSYTIYEIGDSAFYNCKTIKSVVLPKNVQNVGAEAFSHCTSLSAIYCMRDMDKKVTEFDSTALNGVQQCDLYVPAKKIGTYKNNNHKYANIIKPYKGSLYCDGVLYTLKNTDTSSSYAIIEQVTDAFFENGFNVEIPTMLSKTTVRRIGANAFRGSKIQSVIFPQTLSHIDLNAFRDCRYLYNIIVESNNLIIADSAFYNCINLESISCRSQQIPRIESNTFSCPYSQVYVPYKKTSLYRNNWRYYSSNIVGCNYDVYQDGLFYLLDDIMKTAIVSYEKAGCASYADDIVVPTSITVDNRIYRVNEIGNSAFLNCTNLKSISIPNCITAIGQNSFRNNGSLRSIYIPYSVSSIGDNAFRGCSSLMLVNSQSVAPPVCGDDVFDGIAPFCELAVPFHVAKYYQAAKEWRNFYPINESISSMSAPDLRQFEEDENLEMQETTPCIEELQNQSAERLKAYSLDGLSSKAKNGGFKIINDKKVLIHY